MADFKLTTGAGRAWLGPSRAKEERLKAFVGRVGRMLESRVLDWAATLPARLPTRSWMLLAQLSPNRAST